MEEIIMDKDKAMQALCVIKEFADHMEICNHNAYVEARMKLYDIAYENHFTEDFAHYAVKHMKNVDGTQGEHWSVEQTNEVARKHNYNGCLADFYYLMNMFYSDYSHVIGSDADTYAKLAMAYINDPDGKEGRAVKAYLSRDFN